MKNLKQQFAHLASFKVSENHIQTTVSKGEKVARVFNHPVLGLTVDYSDSKTQESLHLPNETEEETVYRMIRLLLK